MATPKKNKSNKTKPPHSKTSERQKKPTRNKIIDAAVKVFADYPYYAASIRMIGKSAKIDHPLINYYFPTKATLFEEVVKHVTDEYYQANITWFEGLEKLGPESGFSLYIDRFFNFAAKHPSALRIVALNLVQAEEHDEIPGYERVRNFFEQTKQTFKNAIPMQGIADDIEMFTHSFNTLAINYLGASTYYAGILGLKPGSRQYLKWVKKTMMFVLLPQLKQIIIGENMDYGLTQK
ncbi:MAG: TetR/AcrR family transcriptional regulator [Desulfobacteraceae bacterium]|nr:TetR/AcrR family transcriptional regulator [Desulfobacteraceae bacterium]